MKFIGDWQNKWQDYKTNKITLSEIKLTQFLRILKNYGFNIFGE
jgi:hypothetical protein